MTKDSWKDQKEDIVFIQCETYAFNLCISSPSSGVCLSGGVGDQRDHAPPEGHTGCGGDWRKVQSQNVAAN